MGISLAMLKKIKALVLFRQPPMAVLDVGSSNLCSASVEGIGRFLGSYRVTASAERDAFVARLTKGSAYE